MKIKKANAILGLLSILLLMLHIGYSVFCYLTFYYDPRLKLLMAIPFMAVCCLHAILGMASVFLLADGTRMDLYPKQNMETVLQRMSAALIFPLLLLHLKTFELLRGTAAGGQWFFFGLIIFAQLLFYAAVLTHTAISLPRALITMGWLAFPENIRKLKRIVYILGGIVFLTAAIAVVRGQIAMIPMFLSSGGAS